METALSIVAGLVLLAGGGELVVRGAVDVARRLGVSELLIGLTLVGFGTSTPELITSLNAALAGSPGIALGNVVGSNIANVLLIFAIVTMIAPVAVDPAALRRDGVVMLAGTAVLIALAVGRGQLAAPAGGLLTSALVVYLVIAWQQEQSGAAGKAAELHRDEAGLAIPPANTPLWLALAMAAFGIALLIFGADLLVGGAIELAKLAGVSETVIGLTIVAVGTSLPELVASLAAAIKGRSDVAFGNIVGSNIYNIFGILGITALVHPIVTPPDMLARDWIALAAAAVLLVVHAATGARVSRWEGAFLFSLYIVYMALLFRGAAA